MTTEKIEAALQQAKDTREVRIGSGVLESVGPMFRGHFGAAPAIVIADENTFRAAGERVQDLLRRDREVFPALVFPAEPRLHPDIENVEVVEARLRTMPAVPVAVGSGTINDLVKLASHQAGRSYLAVATAASMDGYTAYAAAITHQGVKHIDGCPAPRAVLADLDVLSAAPRELTAAGYGDLVGKVIAGADWRLADTLGLDPIEPRSWSMIQPHLEAWLADPAGLTDGSSHAFANLIEGLILSGLAMQVAESSRPASGSEHLFSHLWEMEQVTHHGVAPLHGFKVGIGTLAAASLWEALLERDLPSLDVGERAARWPDRAALIRRVRADHPDPRLTERAVEESLAKHLTPQALMERLRVIQTRWAGLADAVRAVLRPAELLRTQLATAGCPVMPEDIGVSREQLRRSYHRARQIRRRYTVLDLALEVGLLDDLRDGLFRPGGFWGPGPIGSSGIR